MKVMTLQFFPISKLVLQAHITFAAVAFGCSLQLELVGLFRFLEKHKCNHRNIKSGNAFDVWRNKWAGFNPKRSKHLEIELWKLKMSETSKLSRNPVDYLQTVINLEFGVRNQTQKMLFRKEFDLLGLRRLREL